MNRRYLYIQTIGCQMNTYDSDHIQSILNPMGYTVTAELEKADLVIMNTCAVREKAEQKVFSFLGRLADLKRKKPNITLGVGGCVAQQEGQSILDRMPHIDFVFGTRAIARIPDILTQITRNRTRIVDVDMSSLPEESAPTVEDARDGSPTRFVTVMRGCDNFCTYCVVPHVRGRENSREPASILKEIRALVGSGVREVTLLGQNVNSYGKREGFCSFAELLLMVNGIEGLFRIRFTTSHPKDLSDELIHAFGSLDKLCRWIHLPVQSGSNRILPRMNRKYTREEYLDKLKRLRDICPDIGISSDIIVGFPGETREDFQDTVELIKTVGYDSLFLFKYSDRPNAPAIRYPDKVSEVEKKYRFDQVLDLQNRITLEKNRELIGSVQTVLVEGPSKRHRLSADAEWTGRTSTNKIVNFTADPIALSETDRFAGRLIAVRIEKAFRHSLWGRPDRE